VQQILALSRCAVIAWHWFEIDLDDASMEHGARIELRELVPQQPWQRVSGIGRHGRPPAVAGRPVRPRRRPARQLRRRSLPPRVLS
jgi:hypothetical protein